MTAFHFCYSVFISVVLLLTFVKSEDADSCKISTTEDENKKSLAICGLEVGVKGYAPPHRIMFHATSVYFKEGKTPKYPHPPEELHIISIFFTEKENTIV